MKKVRIIPLLIVWCLVFLSNGRPREKDIKMCISSIMVRTESEAKEILQKLNSGADFLTLANLHSLDPGSANWEALSYFVSRKEIDKLNDAAFNLRVRQYSGIIKTSVGYFIIMKTDEISAAEFEKMENSIAQWEFLNQRSMQLLRNGKYEEALPEAKEALMIAKSNLNTDDYRTAMSLNNIGEVFRSCYQYEMALRNYQEALIIVKELNIPKDIATIMNNIGLVYESLGQYEKALNYHEESLKMNRKLKIPQAVATSLNNIGAVYNSLGQYEKALNSFEESLKIYRDNEILQYFATSLSNIGSVYMDLGQYEKALAKFENALKMRVALKIPQGIAANLKNIGAVFLTQKKYRKAEEKFYEAEKEEKKLDTKSTGDSYLVELYLATERYREALAILKEMTPTWRSSDPYKIGFHTEKGLALKGEVIPKEASYEFFKAFSISEDMRQRIKERSGFLGAGTYGGRIRSYRGLVSALSERAINGEKQDKIFTPYGLSLRLTQSQNSFVFNQYRPMFF